MDAKIVSDADADEILSAIGKIEGGEFGPERLRLWKPVVNLSYYEHDDECRVEVANCKGAEVVFSTTGYGADCVLRALRVTLEELSKKGAR